MAVNKTQLETDIKALLNSSKVLESDQQSAIDNFASTLADKISDAIVRGINTATVAPVLTAGSVAVTGTITLTATK
jgi:hypothetical protein